MKLREDQERKYFNYQMKANESSNFNIYYNVVGKNYHDF